MATNVLPKHIAFIMDGNGRWAKQRNKTRHTGHKQGALAFERCINYCIEYNIQYLSVFGFSTENWKRPKKEVSLLMNLLTSTLKKKINELQNKKINVNFIGNISELSYEIQALISEYKSKQFANPVITVNIMFNYGSRQEIVETCTKLINKYQNSEGKMITEQEFNDHLWTNKLPDPDIIVRTGNEYRLSNFMLWQSSYSELIFVKENWPELTKEIFKNIINTYLSRKRKFGDIE